MDGENREDQILEEIEFNYLKSNQFRVIHADGAIGDETPAGKLFLAFYSERHLLPDSQTFKVNEEGRLVSEVLEKRKVNSNGNVMREMEIGIMLDIEVAKGFVISLVNMIREIEKDESQLEQAELSN
jgi:hypothetical protein